MHPILRNILAVLAGAIIGMIINAQLINIGHSIIIPPEGFDAENLKTYGLLETKHLLFPFLGHALGTLVGAYIVARFAISHQKRFAIGIGVLFLIGGILVSTMIPAPVWFIATDLILAYIPMGLLGAKLAKAE